MPAVLQCVISGGQTGADQGALSAAKELGIATAGTAPQGWITEQGPQEQLLRAFGLKECEEPGYPARTRRNVMDADGTLLVGPYADGGSELTVAITQEVGKPVFHVPFLPGVRLSAEDENVQNFKRWIARHSIRILNVAGNRESKSPGIQNFTRAFLQAALSPPLPLGEADALRASGEGRSDDKS